MRQGKAVTIYLSDKAHEALNAAVESRAAEDRDAGLTGYSVTNKSKLISQIVEDYLLEWEGEKLSIKKIADVITPIMKRNGVKRAELFGSYARGEETPESDIDILIDEGSASGLAFFRLQRELEDALGKRVDLQSSNMENEEFLKKIERDRKVLYVS